MLMNYERFFIIVLIFIMFEAVLEHTSSKLCSNDVSWGDIEQAISICESNGGVESISKDLINCKNLLKYGR